MKIDEQQDEQQQQDLQATIDAIDEDATNLADVEAEKRELDPSDPRMVDLSDKAIELASRVQRATITERHLVAMTQRGDMPSID